ncbi:MAG: hypothetical protein H3C47_01730 [Candidatus Cloacimonetes bacterium]|nr:hypothetical protein [Candidatus Cloacimonadota bacterium]
MLTELKKFCLAQMPDLGGISLSIMPLRISAELGRQNFASWYGHLEATEVANCRIAKRVTEKLAGKLCAKVSLWKHQFMSKEDDFLLLGNSIPAVWMRNQMVVSKEGPPRYSEAPELYCSITHSRLWAGSVCSGIPVGIDLEGIRLLQPGACRFFLTDKEFETVSRLRAVNEEANLLVPMIWFVMKEAFLKSEGIGLGAVKDCEFGEEVVRGSCRSFFSGRWHEGRVYRVYDHLLAIAWACDRLST